MPMDSALLGTTPFTSPVCNFYSRMTVSVDDSSLPPGLAVFFDNGKDELLFKISKTELKLGSYKVTVTAAFKTVDRYVSSTATLQVEVCRELPQEEVSRRAVSCESREAVLTNYKSEY